MTKTNKLIVNVLSICFILAALLGVVHFCSFDINFYNKEHSKIMLYGKHINEHIGITNSDLEELTVFTLDYLNDKESSLDTVLDIKGVDREVYTADEKAHMVDVKNLNLASIYIGIAAFVIFVLLTVIYFVNKGTISYLFYGYKKVLIYALLFFAIIGFWILIDFDTFWTTFHHIFFASNDLWLLNLQTDVLIMIVPPEFFDHLVTKIVIIFVIVIIGFDLVLKLIDRKKTIDD